MKEKNKWLTVALVNLSIVALLGVTLRSKILFSIPWLDFKNILHAHSHFAFGGWITLCLLTLMTYEILPEERSCKRKYKFLLGGILLNAVGMLVSFPFLGYTFFSILFSTMFIFVTYAFSLVFIKDLLRSNRGAAINILCITALVSASLSSVGPFTLAYMLASHSLNALLYKDSIYTYLHLQYNGFFTLCIFAIFLQHFNSSMSALARKNAKRFAIVLAISVFPTLCLSYLWHFQNIAVRLVAISGCCFLAISLLRFIIMMRSMGTALRTVKPFAKAIGLLSMIAFMLKTIVQIGIVFPTIGNEVFGDRPIIIGYLHLVMLGFVTLYLLAHLMQTSYFKIEGSLTKNGIIIFSCAVIFNEIVLMTQGLFAMFMISSTIYPLLLWIAAIALFAGALLIAISALKSFSEHTKSNNFSQTATRQFILNNK